MRALTIKLMPQTAPERLAFFALVTTVALCEETIYRGFIQRLFLNVSNGSIAIAILGAAVFFALAHLYQGRRGLMVTLVAGAIFSAVRAWTGSLIPTMAAHFVASYFSRPASPEAANGPRVTSSGLVRGRRRLESMSKHARCFSCRFSA